MKEICEDWSSKLQANITLLIALWLKESGDTGTRHLQAPSNDYEIASLAVLNLRCHARDSQQIGSTMQSVRGLQISGCKFQAHECQTKYRE